MPEPTQSSAVLHRLWPRALASGLAASVAFAAVMLATSCSHRPPPDAPVAVRSPLVPALPGEARWMASAQPKRPPAASVAAPRPNPIRTVPRAALEALVARLVASGAVEHPAAATGAP